MGEKVGSQTNAQDHIKGTGWLTIKSMIQMPWLAHKAQRPNLATHNCDAPLLILLIIPPEVSSV